jgi:hypothetical protein
MLSGAPSWTAYRIYELYGDQCHSKALTSSESNTVLVAMASGCLPDSKFSPVQALKKYRGSRGIAPLILSLGTRGKRVVNVKLGLPHPRSVACLLSEQEAGWAPETFCMFWRRKKSFFPLVGFKSQPIEAVAGGSTD